MRRETQKLRNANSSRGRASRQAQFRMDDDDDTLREVGEEIDLSLSDELESEERRRDPLRLPH